METKKSPKADLENKRPTFILIGLVMALAFIYIAFEWTNTDASRITVGEDKRDAPEEEIVINTQQNLPPPPPPPPADAPPPPEVTSFKADETATLDSSFTIRSTEDNGAALPPPPAPTTLVEEEEDNFVHVIVEKNPEFPGGEPARLKYLQNSLNYPQEAVRNKIQGTVFVQFVVNRDGKIVDVKVVRGVHSLLDNEAIRVVKNMPAWIPAEQQGKKVRSQFTLPVTFTLR
jgi:protein TonB